MPKVDDNTLRQRYEKAKTDWEERQKANRDDVLRGGGVGDEIRGRKGNDILC